MKECTSFEALLDPFVDGALSPEEMARVQSHLDQCPACRSYVDDVLAIRAALGGWEETPVPEDFDRRVMDAVRAHPRRRRTPWKKVVLPLAACFAVVILALPLRTQLLKSPEQTPAAQMPQTAQSEASAEETAPVMEADVAPEAETPVQEDAVEEPLRQAPTSFDTEDTDAPASEPSRMLTGQNGAGSADAPQVYLSAGSVPESDEAGNVYNTAYVFDREGRQIAKHRKVHLFDIDVKGGQRFKESDTLTAGDKATVFDTEFGPMGL